MINYKKECLVYDTETILSFFLASFYDLEEGKYYDFCINDYQNDLYKLIKYLENNKEKYLVGFNTIGFDSIIIEFIYRNYQDWVDKTPLEIAKLIWKCSQKTIDDQKYNQYLPYREWELSFKTIDVPRVMHWFNENKRVSLKQLEFELRAETIENFDVAHNKDSFTPQEVQDLIYYCHNDCKYTYEGFKMCIGDTEHPFYKGKDKLVDRQIIEAEVGLKCLNWDDVKIGAEWNKLDYLSMTKKQEKDLKPVKINHFYGKKYKQFFPKTVSFQSPGIKKYITDIGETFILAQKQEFPYKFNNVLTVNIARGGLHSQEIPRILIPKEDEIYLQNDIGSQYPNAIRKYKIYPKHLGIEWNEMLVSKIQRRLKYKKLAKETKDPKYESLQEMGKLSLNGGAYGRLNTMGDWQQDPCAMLQVTIGCQLEILMIVEALILKGFNVVSCNTDGWDAIIPKSRLIEYKGIVSYYEELIGNKELGNVEYTEFEWIAQTSVNDYIALKKDDSLKEEKKLKVKGDFIIDFELHQNSSFRIINLALKEYFRNNIKPEDFIPSHKDIFDFCARSNSGSTYYHEGYENNTTIHLPKLIRYYVAKEGMNIKKIVKDEVDTNANDVNVQPAEKLKKVCNKLLKENQLNELQNVDFQWYVNKCRETIFKIEHQKKIHKIKPIDPLQGNLF